MSGPQGSVCLIRNCVCSEFKFRKEREYVGNQEWYPGKIEKVNEDGTYAVDYNDGDKEAAVKAELIRLLDDPAAPLAGSAST